MHKTKFVNRSQFYSHLLFFYSSRDSSIIKQKFASSISSRIVIFTFIKETCKIFFQISGNVSGALSSITFANFLSLEANLFNNWRKFPLFYDFLLSSPSIEEQPWKARYQIASTAIFNYSIFLFNFLKRVMIKYLW